MNSVQTVLGPVAVEDLGSTLVHEHLISINAEFERFYPELAWAGTRQERVDHVTALVQAARDRGIQTMLDCTAFFHGRDMDFVREVNSRVDINIIVSSGIYTFDYLPFIVAHRPAEPVADDMLTRMFLRDITVGVGDSGVKAQSIKVATDTEGLTPNNVRILKAAAFASAETGAPITAHTHPHNNQGLNVLETLADGGADPSLVVVAHSGDSTDLAYLRKIMDTGAKMGSDRFGLYMQGTASLEERVATIKTLCDEGYADRIVLSHDCVMFSDWGPPGMAQQYFPDWTPTHISDVVLPKLREAKVSDADITTMMVSAPASLFKSVAS